MPTNVEMLNKIFEYIDINQDKMINDLKDIVAFKSVSGSLEHTNEVKKMMKWVEDRIKLLKPSYCELFDIGSYEVGGKTIRLPNVLLATFGKNANKPTVCIYCAIDVKSVNVSNWNTDPWILTVRKDKMFGRGVFEVKFPLLTILHTIESYKHKLPINLKLIIEGMSQMTNFGLEPFLYSHRLDFIKGIDYVMVMDGEWYKPKLPCIIYGTVGVGQYQLVVSTEDMGEKGRIEEILKYISDQIVDPNGNILVKNLDEDVVPITPVGEAAMDSIDCDLTEMKKTLPSFMKNWSKRQILLRLWRLPFISFEAPKFALCDCGGNSIAFRRKFLLKLVPVQTPKRCNTFIMNHIKSCLEKKFCGSEYRTITKLATNEKKITIQIISTKTNKEIAMVACINISATRPWYEDSSTPLYVAAKEAAKLVYQTEPNFIRMSTDSTIVNVLDKV